MKNKVLSILYIILSILLIIPSIVYLIGNKSVMDFDIYFNFFLSNNISKLIQTVAFLILFVSLTIVYLLMYKNKPFKTIKDILVFTILIGIIFMMMLPWTSSDIFYYMGVGELEVRYNQNPYYVTMNDYYLEHESEISDEILEKGAKSYWGDTTVIYGPMSQLIFKICSFLGLKNVTIGLFIFKIANLIIHIINTYLIYKISGRKNFAFLYGLNPFILIEAIGNVHNDIIVVFFILSSLYFLLKRKNLTMSITFLALGTGIKYLTVLLLPIIILYHFRNEKKLYIRFLRCIEYGILFAIIFIAQYILYFKDYNVLIAVMVQNTKLAKSIYSVVSQYNFECYIYLRIIFAILFFTYYIKFCIDMLTEKNIRFYKIIRKYSLSLILFLLLLTSFQPWYLIWSFATIMWQKPNTIRNIVGMGICAEIANSAYMLFYESYKFDIYFVEYVVILLICWKIITNRHNIKIRKGQVKEI